MSIQTFDQTEKIIVIVIVDAPSIKFFHYDKSKYYVWMCYINKLSCFTLVTFGYDGMLVNISPNVKHKNPLRLTYD